MRIIDIATYTVKHANDQTIEAALRMGLLGAGAGGLVQGIRKLLHRGDPEDSPSILNGMLLGGGLGAAGGAGLASWAGQKSDLQRYAQQEHMREAQPYGVPAPGMAPSLDTVNMSRVPGPADIFNAGRRERGSLMAGIPGYEAPPRAFGLGDTPASLGATDMPDAAFQQPYERQLPMTWNGVLPATSARTTA